MSLLTGAQAAIATLRAHDAHELQEAICTALDRPGTTLIEVPLPSKQW